MISNELVLRRYKQGITLEPPRQGDHDSQRLSVASFLSLPVNFYFMDHDSKFQHMNDITAESCGFISGNDACGKSLRDVSKKNTVEHIHRNDRQVMETGTSMITTETYLRQDDLPLTAVSIKFPRIKANEIVGVFGCSILLGYEQAPSLAEALSLLTPTGILAPDSIPVSECVFECDGQYFDQRDKEILYWLVRGKTAKHIAKILSLSFRTIEHRLEIIKQKLAVSSKSELIDRVFDKFIMFKNM